MVQTAKTAPISRHATPIGNVTLKHVRGRPMNAVQHIIIVIQIQTLESISLLLRYQVNTLLTLDPIVCLNVSGKPVRKPVPPPTEEIALYIYTTLLINNSQSLHNLLP